MSKGIESCDIVAIDPDLRRCGVAFICADGIIDMQMKSIYELFKMLQHDVWRGKVWVVEDVNKIKTIYAKNRKGGRGVQTHIAQSVGMVKAAGSILCEAIEAETGRPPVLAPTGIGKAVKNDAALFNKLTGWTGRTNEDKRDAAAIGLWLRAELASGHYKVNKESGALELYKSK